MFEDIRANHDVELTQIGNGLTLDVANDHAEPPGDGLMREPGILFDAYDLVPLRCKQLRQGAFSATDVKNAPPRADKRCNQAVGAVSSLPQFA